MPKIDITGENVVNALLKASGMTWPKLLEHFGINEYHSGDAMGLINCLYGLCRIQFITIDGVPHGCLDTDAVLEFAHNRTSIMRASDNWRQAHQALHSCWNDNMGWPSRRQKYIYQCEPIFQMPSQDVPQWDIFVAMPLHKDLDAVYRDHICAVAERQKLTVGRADEIFSEQAIIDEIWALIIRSRLIVADCTGRNPNVFYEIGIAHTVGKPVIAITQSTADVPFDLTHRRYIKYEMTPRGMSEFEASLALTFSHLIDAT